VIAVDTNLLVYAHRMELDWNERAAELVRGLAEGGAAWAIPWQCLAEFYGVVTHPSIYKPPSALLLSERDMPWSDLRRLLEAGRIVGPRTHDARIAAICLANGVRELWTADRDFGLFPALRVRNPLASDD
jgi:predicted nucleic acid-binding protein